MKRRVEVKVEIEGVWQIGEHFSSLGSALKWVAKQDRRRDDRRPEGYCLYFYVKDVGNRVLPSRSDEMPPLAEAVMEGLKSVKDVYRKRRD